jgi:hypothetical protein
MAAAAILAHGSAYDVTTVVTAGSPLGVDGFPPGTHVLSLEQQGDVMPLLDGTGNADSAEQVTVRFDDRPPGHQADLADNHDLGHYVAGALAAQASDDASIREQLANLAAQGFVGGADGQEVTSQVFQVTRVP